MARQSVLYRTVSYNGGRCERRILVSFDHGRQSARLTSSVYAGDRHYFTRVTDCTFEELVFACANAVKTALDSNECLAPLPEGAKQRKRTRGRDVTSEEYHCLPLSLIEEIETEINAYIETPVAA